MSGLPFLAVGLAPLWDAGRRAGRGVLIALWIWGAAVTLVAVSTTPQPPANYDDPVVQLLWPAFEDGDLSLNQQSFVDLRADWGRLRDQSIPKAAWNLGEIAGLHGLASLAPLGAVWLACWLALFSIAGTGPVRRPST